MCMHLTRKEDELLNNQARVANCERTIYIPIAINKPLSNDVKLKSVENNEGTQSVYQKYIVTPFSH